MAQERTAKQLLTLWETKREDMMSGDVDTAVLADLVKAAQVGGKTKIKFLAFKGFSRTQKKLLNILAEPSNPYVKGAGQSKPADKPRSYW